VATDFVARTEPFFELEARVLSEKAKGLSDLEVANKLFLHESTVRVMMGQQKVRLRSGRNRREPL
jgi:DNA-binding NarL/FixJ family response regulator